MAGRRAANFWKFLRFWILDFGLGVGIAGESSPESLIPNPQSPNPHPKSKKSRAALHRPPSEVAPRVARRDLGEERIWKCPEAAASCGDQFMQEKPQFTLLSPCVEFVPCDLGLTR